MLRRNTLLGAVVLVLVLAAAPAQAQRVGVGFSVGGPRAGIYAGTTPYVPGYYYSGLYAGYGRFYAPNYWWYNDPLFYYSTRPYYAPRYYPPYTPPSYAFYPSPAVRPLAPATLPARLEVILPDADAQVLIDGRKTHSTGTTRYYDSPPLDLGKTYYYTVTAKFKRDGKEVTEERRVPVTGGQTQVVDFTRP